jgi:hypothetical protein
MRIAVLVVGILGGISAAGAGIVAYVALDTMVADVEKYQKVVERAASGETLSKVDREWYAKAQEVWRRIKLMPPLLCFGGLLGFYAAFLGFIRRGFCAAAVAVVAAVGPVLIAPILIVFTALLLVTAVLAVFVGIQRAPRLAFED